MFALRNIRHINGGCKLILANGAIKSSDSVLKPETKVSIISVRQESIKLRHPIVYKYKIDHITSYGWALLLVPVATFGLGLWQIQRKLWKEKLIEELKTKTNQEPIDLPENLEQLNNLEYQPVRIRGKFLHDRELFLGPRSLVKHDGKLEKAQFISTQNPFSFGYLVVTPFKIEGREETVLINRGWVPKNKVDPKTRSEGQITNTVELVGIVRQGEARKQFTPKSTGTNFLYRDLPKMCALTEADPYFLDAVYESTVPGGPIGGQTIVTLRNEHLQYIITWLSLSVLTSLFWYKLVFNIKRTK